ncbi:hypothetical protein BGX33_006934 [Mortierella sp. NVP41]|nr:hypothetical protein BGX33_006934 [Mortierella sp. NVP41]
MKHQKHNLPFKILIAGAGIGGLVMGLMLEKAGIPFLILERSETIQPIGGAISLCPNIMRAMDQLGLMEALLDESVPIGQIRYYDRMEGSHSLDYADAATDMYFCESRYGNAIRTIQRSVFVALLLSRIPRHKILFGKRVVRTRETTIESLKLGGSSGFVTCYCHDGSEYHGSILVGADGSYSTIRKSMYQTLFDIDELERQDVSAVERVMPYQHCIVGITQPLDPVEFEVLGQELGEFQALRGQDTNHSIWLMPMTNYRIAWNAFFHLPDDLMQEYKDLQSGSVNNNHDCISEKYTSLPGQYPAAITTTTTNTPSTPPANPTQDGSWQSISKRVHDRAKIALEGLRDTPNPLSKHHGRFGDLLDKTETNKISSVNLEQGVCRRWFHGRTVLIGDACHKSLPYAGQGANQAILDSIFLVSKLYLLVKPLTIVTATTIRSSAPTPNWYTPLDNEVTHVFEQYYRQRSAIAGQATWGGSWADVIFGGQGWGARMVRFAFFKLMPTALFYKVSDPYFRLQPVLPFLPDARPSTGLDEK